ncbi:TPA: type IV conjugative transfer system protein TraL [Klebsiella pneumoniae]|jgi:conjugal transfer pilus assembly protein TraL|uniref:Type IV conjugative transfer system protein TraL n=1 Tax=Klebsiella michiganensis TaxID=1134687 RepID=A0A2J5A1X6_9ENTR|nr:MULTISPECIES: type IV conjugative transfer system protein TraL [Enterobacterales]AUW01925.1 type IV conjugative transfer system protein TraL [Klebsiella oxytoca]EDQ6258912.1 type IV conjugative transfer system protein TraL [Salmonella enterica subsp. enterica]MDI0348300.1 type IV conjugative transfer system protein TraL [Raoultella ornithinolytica]BDT52552.1 conjugal transfer protein [Raoultella planticola]HBZ8693090.1 type IV conjugative transfer system protein TraL [Citrobacter freundii]
MEQRNRYQFPGTFSDQKRYVGLPLDELVIYVPVALLAIFVNMWIFSPTLAAAVIGIRILKKGKGSSFLLNLAYWFLPTTLMRFFISVLPESYKRHWIA